MEEDRGVVATGPLLLATRGGLPFMEKLPLRQEFGLDEMEQAASWFKVEKIQRRGPQVQLWDASPLRPATLVADRR